jgi:hypothetical protein
MTIGASGAFAASTTTYSQTSQPATAQAQTSGQVQAGSSDVNSDQAAMRRAYDAGMRNSEDAGRVGSDGM